MRNFYEFLSLFIFAFLPIQSYYCYKGQVEGRWSSSSSNASKNSARKREETGARGENQKGRKILIFFKVNKFHNKFICEWTREESRSGVMGLGSTEHHLM